MTNAAGERSLTERAQGWVKSLSYLPKWLLLGSVIGVIAGLGAVLFYEALTLATHFFLSFLAGYSPPTPAGEGNSLGSATYSRAWAIPLVVVLGAIASGYLVFTLAPEAEGHGTDAAIDAVHKDPRGIRLRAVIVKIIASALTIGSGGSGGREGPTAQISAGFGSLLTRVLDLPAKDGRIAVSIGIGSGIGAIFSAPLGGAVLAADIVYRDDFEFEALLPGLFASVVAWAIFGGFYGYKPLFAIPGYHFSDPLQLLWFAILGLVAGLLGLLYSKSFYGIVALNKLLPFTAKLRPALGGLCVGLIALALPQVLGTGYGWIQEGLSGHLSHLSLIIVIALPFARILATSLSIGTGGSGGVFGPGMVIGAFTGFAVWRVLAPIAPGVGHSPAVFAVVGMMAVFGGISRAPLAVMLMVAQMTGNISILAPAMVAVAISTFIVRRFDDSIYRSQLRSRDDSVAERTTAGLPLLAAIPVRAAATSARIVLRTANPAADALAALRTAGVPGAPVADEDGTYLGTVSAQALERAAARSAAAESANGAAAGLGAILDAGAGTVQADADLSTGINALIQAGGRWVTVTDSQRRVVGILSAGDIVRSYQRAVDASAGAQPRAPLNAEVVTENIGAESSLAGTAVRDAGLPSGCVVVSLKRGGDQMPVTGSTVLASGDVITVLVAPDAADYFRNLATDAPEPAPTPGG